ncbi:hypothetical protein PtA15_5A538 [Puccinia triticina]|uniref:Uncharacterized protein n=1 Tax=Puccinia triticina TaxID=208348 RepID=A0ABY7CMC5_9BASI|nr:uncharacterized protein PtA15_5A538 [Puccinia triticina]WAQ84965.1 hypothetical protein PtA15_5A538 [Puccinia triticina]
MPSRSFDHQEAGKQCSLNCPSSALPSLVNLSLLYFVFILALISIPLVFFTSPFLKSRGILLGQNLQLANQTPPAHFSIVRLAHSTVRATKHQQLILELPAPLCFPHPAQN